MVQHGEGQNGKEDQLRTLPSRAGRAAQPIKPLSVWKQARRPTKISDRLARQIVDDILARDLRPGTMLPPEAEMVRDYKVSRGTLRESLRLLEVQGLLVVKPGPRGGPMVAEPDSLHFASMMKFYLRMQGATYREVLSARLAVEPMMARLAAEAQDEAGIQALRRTIAACQAAEIQDEAAWVRTSHELHSVIAGISGNKVLNLIGMALKDIYHVWAQTSHTPLRLRSRVLEVHGQIADAIFRGDGAEAERLMREDMTSFGKQSNRLHAASLDGRIEWE